jgi:hypothetical protein
MFSLGIKRSLSKNCFWTFFLLSTVCWGCTKSINSHEDFEKLMGAKLPENSLINYTKNAGKAGAIIVAHLSRTNFPAFSASRDGYSEWHALTNRMDFDAAGKTFRSPGDVRGEYSVGKSFDGVCRVLIWDEKSETLTALLSTGF